MAELRFSVHLHYTTRGPNQEVDWEVPVLATEGANDVGIGELLEAIKRHRTILGESGALERRRQRRRRGELEALLVEEFTAQVMARVRADPELTRALDLVSSGGLDPYSAVAQILGRTLRSGPP
jgi:LAO/AO transport system kinase